MDKSLSEELKRQRRFLAMLVGALQRMNSSLQGQCS